MVSLLGQAVFTAAVALLPLGGHSFQGAGVENFWLILAVTAVASLTGGGSVSLALMFAVLGDVSAGMSAVARTRLYVLLEVFQWVGSTVGPFAGVWVAGHFGSLRASFVLCTCSLVAAALFAMCCPETLPADRRVPFDWQRCERLYSAACFPCSNVLSLAAAPRAAACTGRPPFTHACMQRSLHSCVPPQGDTGWATAVFLRAQSLDALCCDLGPAALPWRRVHRRA